MRRGRLIWRRQLYTQHSMSGGVSPSGAFKGPGAFFLDCVVLRILYFFHDMGNTILHFGPFINLEAGGRTFFLCLFFLSFFLLFLFLTSLPCSIHFLERFTFVRASWVRRTQQGISRGNERWGWIRSFGLESLGNALQAVEPCVTTFIFFLNWDIP